jgi:hypothetical protein
MRRKKAAVASGSIIHSTQPLTILGGDPGKVAGIVLVHFPQRRADGAPLWDGARIHGTASVSVLDVDGATHAERDILFRRRIVAAIAEFPFAGAADVVALEEPLDGGLVYSKNPSQDQTGQQRDTGFRLGAYYALLQSAAVAAARPNRVISFPVRTHRGRRGWMRSNRKNTLLASEGIMRTRMSAEGYRHEQGRNGKVPEHVFMALGVVNHLVEYWLDYFPRTS